MFRSGMSVLPDFDGKLRNLVHNQKGLGPRVLHHTMSHVAPFLKGVKGAKFEQCHFYFRRYFCL